MVIQLRKRLREVMLLSSCSSFLETSIRGESNRTKGLMNELWSGMAERELTLLSSCSSFLETSIRGESSRMEGLQIKGVEEV